MSHFTATDVAAHQERTLGGVRCTCTIRFLRESMGGHSTTCPQSIKQLREEQAFDDLTPKLRPTRKLKKLREPNATETEFGRILEAQKRNGEIEYYGFEEITLRWADMAYTPDYFVIRSTGFVENVYTPSDSQEVERVTDTKRRLIEAVYIELKGAHRWEDSIIKWKSAKARFTWAEFQLWQKLEGQWNRLG